MVPLLVAAVLLVAASGFASFLAREKSDLGQTMSHLLHLAGSVLGIGIAVSVLLGGQGLSSTLGYYGDNFAVSLVLDPLAAAFLIPVLLVANLSSLFGLDYWRQSRGALWGRYLRVMFGLVTAGLCGVIVSGDIISFLVAWEVMALSAFFLIITEDSLEEVRAAGWIYFVTAHVSTLLLFGLFGFAWSVSGSHVFADIAAYHFDQSSANTLFLLAVVAFGIKAGVFPGHFWLPPAHASAPSHVSALMSGVLIKIGIYGLMRTVLMLQGAIMPWWGTLILTLGIFSSVLGVAFALGQHDLKRLLAYHSVENIGIILLGFGIMLLGYSQGSAELITLGFTGALLHVWNHALFKSLLFLSAGTVVHATGTREIDLLGGLGRVMPRSALFFLLGAIAICGLPPLNGFVSEFAIYLGFFRGFSEYLSFLMVGGCLALAVVGGLAVGCFVKAFGAVFLGVGRSEHVERAHEAGRYMQLAMLGLAGGCLTIALFPLRAIALFGSIIDPWIPNNALGSSYQYQAASLSALSIVNPVVFVVTLISCIVVRKGINRGINLTWDCGFIHPTHSMQYTSSSFAQMFVALLSRVLLPRSLGPELRGYFPAGVTFKSSVPDVVLERAIFPSFDFFERCLSRVKILQRGNLQAYVLYILVTFVLLVVLALRGYGNG